MIERTTARPVLIEGKSLLSVVNAQGLEHNFGIVYHGSPKQVPILKPQLVYWRVSDTFIPDSDTEVVCATRNPLPALLIALVPRRGLPIGFEPNEQNGLDLWVHHSLRDEFVAASGYVSVIDSDAFEDFNGGVPTGYTGSVTRRAPELRATTPQVPLFNLRVTHNDLLEQLEAQTDCNMQYR